MLFFNKKNNKAQAVHRAPAARQPGSIADVIGADLLKNLVEFTAQNFHIDCAVLQADGTLLAGELDVMRKNSVKDPQACEQTRAQALALVRETNKAHSVSCETGVRFCYIPVVHGKQAALIFLLCEEQRRYDINPERFRLAQRTVSAFAAMLEQTLRDAAQAKGQFGRLHAHIGELKQALSCTVFENEIISGIYGAPILEDAIRLALAQVGDYYGLARITVLRLTCDFGEQKLLMQWLAPGFSGFDERFGGAEGRELWQVVLDAVQNEFDTEGYLHIQCISDIPGAAGRLIAQDGIEELLCDLIRSEQRPVAVVIYERTGTSPVWDDTRLTGLKAASAVVCGAVLQQCAMDYAEHAKQLMYTIADGNGSATYAVDAKTREILFMNCAMQYAHPNVKPGDLCTRLENLDEGQICAFCPLERFSSTYEPTAMKTAVYGNCPLNEQLRMEIYKSNVDNWYELQASRFTWFDGREACLISQNDINTRKVFELEVEKLAYYDAMLDIPNRACLTKVLGKVFEAPEPAGSVIVLDLDDFKYVNDTLGSHYGDELLRRIVQYFNEHDELVGNVFRFGGDEFFILLQDHTLQQAQELADRIRQRFCRPWKVFDVDCTCTVSMGIAGFPESGKDPQEIVASVEFAIYDAKTAGKNRYVLYDEVLSKKLARRHRIQEILRRAVNSDGFEVYYQPIYHIRKQRFIKAEALLRLRDEELGFIPPDEFIGIAEEMGLISDIGLMVADRVCQTLCELAQKGIVLDTMAINISPIQLAQENFVDSIWGVISRYELPPTVLEFEITENVVIRSFDSVKKTMAELQRYGISFALDDFGSGYSGLNYLLMLPISCLKIDKSYINQLEGSIKSRKMLAKIIELVQDFNMQVVAEGVETTMQESILRALNCDYIQGYLYSRPLPRAEFERLMEREQQSSVDVT